MNLIQNRYRVLRQLCETLYGGVLLCRDELQQSRLVVLKCVSLLQAINMLDMRKPELQSPDDPRQEKAFANLMREGTPHPHIVQYLDDFIEGQTLYFVLEYCAGGDLFSSVNQGQNRRLDCTDALNVLKQVSTGVAFLHRHSIAHRDLSLENVMLSQGGVCKIGDFGLSTRTDRVCYERVGKEYYMAPEVVVPMTVYDPKAADVWSLGMILFILVTGSPLVSLASAENEAFCAFKKVGVRKVLEAWHMTPLLWENVIELLDAMLQCDPSKRLTIEQRIPLRGFERMVTSVDGVSMKIVHSMLVAGDIDTLLRFLPTTLMQTFNMHPRMRALQIKDKDFMAEIQAPLTLQTILNNDLLRIRKFSNTDTTSTTNTTNTINSFFNDWEKYAEDECNVGFDRYTQFPFFLTVWTDEKAEQARLMLFSDHYMSDGYSGMVVLNCILERTVILTNQEIDVKQTGEISLEAFPLRPSVYQMWLSKVAWAKPLMKGVISLFGKTIYRSEMQKFSPVLPARVDQHDFTVPPVTNPTTASFAQGDPVCMRKALARCKEEGVTFAGALVSAIVLAFYHAAKDQPTFDPEKPFKFVADLDYNMRQRVPCPAKEDQVGMYVAFSGLEWLANKGVDLYSTRFWDLARQAKQEIDKNLRHTLTMAAITLVVDQRVNAKMDPSFVKAVNIQHSQTSDANVSNVGRYPYIREHQLPPSENGQTRALTVTNLHVYNPIPHLGPSATLFLSSVETFNYSMGHKCEDDAAKSLFKAWVTICEAVGSVSTDEITIDVLHRLNL
ncbi:hypothetical protein BBI17_009512 [Phytophthora kernoviae]|uniref:Protein kinase domain-containing protein n=1 Tax=Phytophthora kernoviae TaxID=325452 RepID=A0A421FDK4_9STRA|nr:hypothetical protein BBI17_009512 [Phytophthora kernoviae]